LELTGIYRLRFDDARQTRGFALQLRSPADIVVYEAPRVWTLQRALLALAALGGCTLLGLAWITALRRRVQKQTEQIREQLERQARLEAEVQHAARLESLGVLAGGIAHDFNNLLTIIVGNLGLAMLDVNIASPTAHCLKEIERGAARAQTLTRQLLTFAKGGDPVRAPVALGDIVRESADRALHGSSVRCEYEIAPDLWLANADKDQLAQVVQNLVLNATQAMPEGGTLRIALSNETLGDGAKKSLPAGRYVRLTITDSGVGMEPEIIPKIFDPYFSTRRTGSGLGLATVYSIIKRHEGAIEVHSTVGIGTTFDLWLPAADAPAIAAGPVTTESFAPVRTAGKVPRVLLMDDEESIRQLAEMVLRRMGLEPTVVAEGASAVREFSVAQLTGRPFDLLILDLTIVGGLGGKEVVELIRKLDAHVPAIVSSGYSSDLVMANFAAFGFQAMVSKPYEIGQLAAVINQLLGRSAS
jgi:signal transduction histidine kinase/CheY-like chemotaxis protein